MLFLFWFLGAKTWLEAEVDVLYPGQASGQLSTGMGGGTLTSQAMVPALLGPTVWGPLTF